MYRIAFDSKERVLRIRNRGLWNPQIHHEFSLKLKAECARIQSHFKRFAILLDVREHPIQPAELNDASGDLTAQVLEACRGPAAVVVGSMLAKLQAERVLGRPGVRVFHDIDEAQLWLHAQLEQQEESA